MPSVQAKGMSIFSYGQVVTVLGPYGAPCKTLGMLYRSIMIPLQIQLQVAGPVPSVFPSPTPQNFCQDSNDGIQVIVQVLDQNANPLNISAATSTALLFMRPDGTTMRRAATFLTNGYDGQVYYSTVAADIVQDGTWQVQASFVVAAATKTTQWGQFQVGANILAP